MATTILKLDELAGSIAVVTGGFSGIGLALGKLASAYGCNVALLDVEESKAATAAGEIHRKSPSCEVLVLHTDVTSKASVDGALAGIQARWPQSEIGLLFCNAGVLAQRGGATIGILDSTLDDWQFTMNVNVFGVINSLQTFVPVLRSQQRRSCVVNTASAAGITWSGMGPYSVSKHACAAITESLHSELLAVGVQNVSAHCLCPGIIATSIFHAERNRPAELQPSGPIDTKETEALRRATQDLVREEAISADAAAAATFEQLAGGKFWLLVDNPPPMAWDIKGAVGRRIASILTGYAPQQPPPGYVQQSLQRRAAEWMSKL